MTTDSMNHDSIKRNRKMTTAIFKNVAVTLPSTKFSGHAGNVTYLAGCLPLKAVSRWFRIRVSVGVRFSVWFVSGYAHVFVLLFSLSLNGIPD